MVRYLRDGLVALAVGLFVAWLASVTPQASQSRTLAAGTIATLVAALVLTGIEQREWLAVHVLRRPETQSGFDPPIPPGIYKPELNMDLFRDGGSGPGSPFMAGMRVEGFTQAPVAPAPVDPVAQREHRDQLKAWMEERKQEFSSSDFIRIAGEVALSFEAHFPEIVQRFRDYNEALPVVRATVTAVEARAESEAARLDLMPPNGFAPILKEWAITRGVKGPETVIAPPEWVEIEGIFRRADHKTEVVANAKFMTFDRASLGERLNLVLNDTRHWEQVATMYAATTAHGARRKALDADFDHGAAQMHLSAVPTCPICGVKS